MTGLLITQQELTEMSKLAKHRQKERERDDRERQWAEEAHKRMHEKGTVDDEVPF